MIATGTGILNNCPFLKWNSRNRQWLWAATLPYKVKRTYLQKNDQENGGAISISVVIGGTCSHRRICSPDRCFVDTSFQLCTAEHRSQLSHNQAYAVLSILWNQSRGLRIFALFSTISKTIERCERNYHFLLHLCAFMH